MKFEVLVCNFDLLFDYSSVFFDFLVVENGFSYEIGEICGEGRYGFDVWSIDVVFFYLL